MSAGPIPIDVQLQQQPFQAIDNNQFQQQQQQQHFWQNQPINPAPAMFGQPDTTFDEFDPASISAMELWNRFQSFYEPTPVSWGAGLGGEIAQMQPGVGGSVYDGMFIGGYVHQ
jgi:hypothetical protein